MNDASIAVYENQITEETTHLEVRFLLLCVAAYIQLPVIIEDANTSDIACSRKSFEV